MAELALTIGTGSLAYILANGLDRFLATYNPNGDPAKAPKHKFTSDGAGTLANALNLADHPGWIRIGAGVGMAAAPAVASAFVKHPLLRSSLEGAAVGASVQLVAKDGQYAQLRLPSGEVRNVDVRCRATVGEVGNAEQSNINWGKAGRMRWKGKRPTVRGVAMNPVDHPHGGGEGKTSGGRNPVSPWGQKEGRTRRPNKDSDKLIVRRRRTGKKR